MDDGRTPPTKQRSRLPDRRTAVLYLVLATVVIAGFLGIPRIAGIWDGSALAGVRTHAPLLVGSMLLGALLLLLAATGHVWSLVRFLVPGRRRSDRPVRAFHDALRAAARSVESGQLGQAAELQGQALARFAADAAPQQLTLHRDAINQALLSSAPGHPQNAIGVMATLAARAPSCLAPAVVEAAVRAWAATRDQRHFDASWQGIARVWGDGHLDRIHSSLDGVPQGQVSREFRDRTAIRVIDILDGSWRAVSSAVLPAGCQQALRLLELVNPADPSLAGADWLCLLGDRTAGRGQAEEATARYRAALDAGSTPARERLAHQHALRGHRLQLAGDLGAAHASFGSALSLRDDPEYRLLSAVTGLLCEHGSPLSHLQQLEQLGATDFPAGELAFWTGLGALLAGQRQHATAILDEIGADRAAAVRVELLDMVEVLSAVAADDRAAVARGVAEVLAEGDGWPDRYPIEPESAVAAVARHEPERLAEVLVRLPPGLQIGEPTGLLAAHVLLEQAVNAVGSGAFGPAVERLEAAELVLAAT